LEAEEDEEEEEEEDEDDEESIGIGRSSLVGRSSSLFRSVDPFLCLLFLPSLE